MQGMQNKTRERLNMTAGYIVTGAAALLILYFTFYAVKSRLSFASSQYFAYFEQGDGLARGTEVTLNGLTVGKVQDVRVSADGRIRLAFVVERSYLGWLRQGTRARIERNMIIGRKRVALVPGRASAAQLSPGAVLQSEESSEIIDLVSGRSLEHFMREVGLMGEDEQGDEYDSMTVREIYNQTIAALFSIGSLQVTMRRIGVQLEQLNYILSTNSLSINDLSAATSGTTGYFEELNRSIRTLDKSVGELSTIPSSLDNLLQKTEILLEAFYEQRLIKRRLEKIERDVINRRKKKKNEEEM
jgi:phospholipid/cholesterol/gamma-HCH transport system substrate-binding protein